MANFSKLNIGDRVASSGLRRFRKLSVEQLPSPYGVSLDGDYLTWGDYSILATSFDILVDGVVKATVSAPTNSFDLSTLGLADGTYSISVVSKAEGYLDSEPSEAVSYTVADDSIVGTWLIKDKPTLPSTAQVLGATSGTNYIGVAAYYNAKKSVLGFSITPSGIRYFYEGNANNWAYWQGVWDDSSAKLVEFNDYAQSQSNVQHFLDWLKANATKQ